MGWADLLIHIGVFSAGSWHLDDFMRANEAILGVRERSSLARVGAEMYRDDRCFGLFIDRLVLSFRFLVLPLVSSFSLIWLHFYLGLECS